jgi:hypothetical protein
LPIRLSYPAFPCFPKGESSNLNYLILISPRLARAGAETLRQRKLGQPARPATRHPQSEAPGARSRGTAARRAGAVKATRPQASSVAVSRHAAIAAPLTAIDPAERLGIDLSSLRTVEDFRQVLPKVLTAIARGGCVPGCARSGASRDLSAGWRIKRVRFRRRSDRSLLARRDALMQLIQTDLATGGWSMNRPIFFLTLLASMLVLAVSSPATAEVNPASLAEQDMAAQSRGDVTGARLVWR